MIYLVVGLDRTTFAPWHENVQAGDATGALEIALDRAWLRGISLAVAAVIGANSKVLLEPSAAPARAPRAA